MISNVNKRFLKEKFNIDSNNFSEEELNQKIDSILAMLDKEINESKGRIGLLLEELKKESYNS